MRGLPVTLVIFLGASGCGTFEASSDSEVDASNDAKGKLDASIRDAGDAGAQPTSDAQSDAPPGPDYKTACTTGKRVFVSSRTFSANFGSAAAADGLCDELARNAGVSGQWFAWLSASGGHDAIGLMPAQTPYYLLDCTTQITGSRLLLANGSLTHGIDRDEKWGSVSSDQAVWTGTKPDGTFSNKGCNDWTSSAFAAQGTAGFANNTSGFWTNAPFIVRYEWPCNWDARIYCFEK